jgi:hypothetical protein
MTLLGASLQELAAEEPAAGPPPLLPRQRPARSGRTDVPLYGAVRYRQSLPGIDVLIPRTRKGTSKYDHDPAAG